jgi:DNA-binding NtrC family response regulator
MLDTGASQNQPLTQPKPLLLVEPDDKFASVLEHSVAQIADVHRHAEFDSACTQLSARAFALVVTSLRLQAYNGLQLVHLSLLSTSRPACIVYTDGRDLSMARDIQTAGAFYERADRLPVMLASYCRATALPPSDRRDPEHSDRRRTLFRGGRRAWDRKWEWRI